MSALYLFLNENGLMLLSGITIIMLIGTLVTLLFRAPILKQRTAEFTILGSIFWLALASIPLPRYDITPLISSHGETIQEKETPEPKIELAFQSPDPLEPVGEFSPITQEKSKTSPEDQSLVLGKLTKEQLKLLEEISTQDDKSTPNAPQEIPETASIRNEPITQSPLVQNDPEIIDSEQIPESEAGLPVTGYLPIPENTETKTELSEREPASAWMTGITNWLNENLSLLKNRMTEIYLVGFLMTLFWLMVGQISLYRLKRNARKAEDWIREIYQNLDEISGLRNATLLISSETDRAMTFGVWNPVILLPQSLCTEENQQTVKQVLLHERAHVQRYDALGRVLFNLAFPLFYFHPLFWWLRTSSYHSAELVADEAAALQSSRTEYAEALVSLIKNHPQRTVMMNNAMPIFKTPSSFYRRMETLVTRTKNLETRLSRFWKVFGLTSFAVVLLATTSVLGIRQLQAEPESNAVATSPDENPTEEKKETPPVEDPKTEKTDELASEEKKDESKSETSSNETIREESPRKKEEVEPKAIEPEKNSEESKPAPIKEAQSPKPDSEKIRQLQVDNLLKLMKTDGSHYEIRYTVKDLKSLLKINEMIGSGELTGVDKSKGIHDNQHLKYQDFTTTAENHGKIYQKLLELEPDVKTTVLTTTMQSYSVPKENWKLVSHMISNPVINQFFERKNYSGVYVDLGYSRTASPNAKFIFNEKRKLLLVVGTPSDQERVNRLIEYLKKPSDEVSGIPFVLVDYQHLHPERSPSELQEQAIVLMDTTFLKAENDDIKLASQLVEAIMESRGEKVFLFSHFSYSGRDFILTRNYLIPKIKEAIKQIRALPTSEQTELKKNTKGLSLGLRKKLNEAKLTTNPEQKKALEMQVEDRLGLVTTYAKTEEKSKPVEKNPYVNDKEWKKFIKLQYPILLNKKGPNSGDESNYVVYIPTEKWTEENRKDYINGVQTSLNRILEKIPTIKLQLQYRVSRMISNAKLTQVMLFIETPQFTSPSKIVSKKFTEEELVRYQIEQIYMRLTDRAPTQDEMVTLQKIYSKNSKPAMFAFELSSILGIQDSDTERWYVCKEHLKELDQVESETREEMKKLSDREPTLVTCYLYYRLGTKVEDFEKRCEAAISMYDQNQTKVRKNPPTFINYPGMASTTQVPKTGPMPVAGQPAGDVKIRNHEPLPVEATKPAPGEEKKKYPFDKEPSWSEFVKMGGAKDLPASYREKEIKGYLTELERIQKYDIPSLKLKFHQRRNWPGPENAVSRTIQLIESGVYLDKDSAKTNSQKPLTKETELVEVKPEELARIQVTEIYGSLLGRAPDKKELEYLIKIYTAGKESDLDKPMRFLENLLEIHNLLDPSVYAWGGIVGTTENLEKFEPKLNEFLNQHEELLNQPTLENHFRVFQLNQDWKQLKHLAENSIKQYDQVVRESQHAKKKTTDKISQESVVYEKASLDSLASIEKVDLLKLATKYSDVVQQYQETAALEKILKPKFDAGIPSDSDDSYRDKYLSSREKLKSLRNQIQFLKQLAEISLNSTEEQLELEKMEYDRLATLHKSGVTTNKDLDQKKIQIRKTENELKILLLIMDNEYANEILKGEPEKAKEESKPAPSEKKAG